MFDAVCQAAAALFCKNACPTEADGDILAISLAAGGVDLLHSPRI